MHLGLVSAVKAAQHSPGEWSLNDMLAHLRACADMWGACSETILAEDGPIIWAVNPKTWIKQTDYPELEFQPSLRSFTTQRADLLAILEPLPHESWSRTATVTGRESRSSELGCSMRTGWLAMNGRTSLHQIARIVNMVRVWQ